MELTWGREEMAGAALWDQRCVRSVAAICEARLNRPRVSFSKACGDALRQAGHRICAHRKTTVEGLLRGHFCQTARRCEELYAQAPEHPILLVTDTTSLNYASHPATEGLGPINQTLSSKGLLAHSVLALPFEGLPAGLAHVAIWARDPERLGQSRERHARRRRATATREGQKWIDALWGAEATLPSGVPGLLIADREADFYELFAAPRRPGLELLVRAHQPRRVTGPDLPTAAPLLGAIQAVASWGTVEIEVPRQRGKPARTAVLEVRSTAVHLPRPTDGADSESGSPESIGMWAVYASEIDPPPGAEPLRWLLLTSMPVRSFQEARLMLRYYTRRWVIEELHLVLKSGFGAERLQCDDAHTLKNCLALLYVVSWKVLHLRDIARCVPETSAAEVVEADELAVLEANEGRALLTARDVVRAIAHLGGFPRNPSAGEPGVRSLWDGLQRLEGAVAGWRLAHSSQTYEPR
jgi:hypothetical protein